VVSVLAVSCSAFTTTKTPPRRLGFTTTIIITTSREAPSQV
jgi:hypothetical protein